MVLQVYRDVGVRALLIDEAHNMLSGSTREQRRILTHLRYLSNELRLNLVCLGTAAAREAIHRTRSSRADSVSTNSRLGRRTASSPRWWRPHCTRWLWPALPFLSRCM